MIESGCCVFVCFVFFIKMWLKRCNKRSKGKMCVAAMHLILCGQMSQTTYLLQCFFIIIIFSPATCKLTFEEKLRAASC